MKAAVTQMGLLTVTGLLSLCLVRSSATVDLYANCNSDDTTLTTDATGTINEPPNQEFYNHTDKVCRWEIKDSSNKDVLFFNLSSLDIGGTAGSDCSSENLRVFDCAESSQTTWFEECGQVTSPKYFSGTSNDACIWFQTSRTTPAETSLTLDWWHAPICSGGIYFDSTTELDTFESVSWPWYEGTPDCQYRLTAPQDYVRVTISDFTTTTATDCTGDYVEIANALDPTEIWFKFCKPTQDRSVYGAGASALITYHRTNGEGSLKGSWHTSAVKGHTLKQRQTIIIGAAVGIGVLITVLILLAVIIRCCKSSPCYYEKMTKSNQPYSHKQGNKRTSAVSPSSASENPNQTLSVPLSIPRAQPPTEKLPHIMISYQWDVKRDVLIFRQELEQAGYRVWIDIEQMHKSTSTFDAMTDAIEYAAVVVPVLTAKYQESVNCRKEIEYADKSKKPIVPVLFEKKFKPTKWLSFLLGNSPGHDLSDRSTYSDQLEKFFDTIAQLGEPAKRGQEIEEDPEIKSAEPQHEGSYVTCQYEIV